jgi:hypothetical protein
MVANVKVSRISELVLVYRVSVTEGISLSKEKNLVDVVVLSVAFQKL